MKKLNISKDFLYQEYITNKKSTYQIAKQIGCTASTIGDYLKINNIKRIKILTKKFLYQEYIINKKSINKIAKKVKCSCQMIHYWLRKYNIPVRTPQEASKLKNIKGKNNPNYKNGGETSKIHYCKELDCDNEITYQTWKFGGKRCHFCAGEQMEHYSKWDKILTKEFLITEYITNKKSALQIAIEIGCDSDTVLRYLRIENIAIKAGSEFLKGKPFSKQHRQNLSKAFKGKFGKENNHYIDGRTSLYNTIRHLEEYEEWRKQIFKRDNYTCQHCGDNKGHNLNAHHIKYFKQLLSNFLEEYNQFSPIEDKETLIRLAIKYKPFWNIDNGITLCEDCHREEHSKNKIKETINV